MQRPEPEPAPGPKRIQPTEMCQEALRSPQLVEELVLLGVRLYQEDALLLLDVDRFLRERRRPPLLAAGVNELEQQQLAAETYARVQEVRLEGAPAPV